MARNRVVVGIFVHKPGLTPFEKISLIQCWRVLRKYPIRLICPRNMDVDEYLELAPGIQVDPIDPLYLSSYQQYRRLILSSFLYDHLNQYVFMLTYVLDAFVFRDELLEWCAAGWDYIGAPWFQGFDSAAPNADYLGTGNGGFSLRCVKSLRAVSHSWKMILPAREVWATWMRNGDRSRESLAWLIGFFTWRNRFCRSLKDFQGTEDLFWCTTVPQRFDWFRLAPVEEARKFSFEVHPRRLLEETGRLPFGCHKWHKYDLPFWKPIIESFGFELP
jgi:hypothetical protein